MSCAPSVPQCRPSRTARTPGYDALVNAKRAAFIVELLGRAVGEECVSLLTHILDHVHYDVLEYLGETGENDA